MDKNESFEYRYGIPILDADGFTMVPGILLRYGSKLPLSSDEVLLIIHAVSFKWTSDHPYPSVAHLADRMGCSVAYIKKLLHHLTTTPSPERPYLRRIPRIDQNGQHPSACDFTFLWEALMTVKTSAETIPNTAEKAPQNLLQENGGSAKSLKHTVATRVAPPPYTGVYPQEEASRKKMSSAPEHEPSTDKQCPEEVSTDHQPRTNNQCPEGGSTEGGNHHKVIPEHKKNDRKRSQTTTQEQHHATGDASSSSRWTDRSGGPVPLKTVFLTMCEDGLLPKALIPMITGEQEPSYVQ